MAYQPFPELNMNMDTTGGLSLRVVQQPISAKVAGGKDKDRKPVDPPPVVQLVINEKNFDRNRYGNPEACLQSPSYTLCCRLQNDSPDGSQDVDCDKLLVGTTVSSLHKLKDNNNIEGGYFVFGDLTAKKEGHYKLIFELWEFKGEDVELLTTVTSARFQVHTQRTFPGMMESTSLTRHFSDQGVRLRLRKDSRNFSSRKRNASRAALADQQRLVQSITREGQHGLGHDNFSHSKRPRYDGASHAMQSQVVDSIATTMAMQTSLPTRSISMSSIDYDAYNSPYMNAYTNYTHSSVTSPVNAYKGVPYSMPLTPSSMTMGSHASQSTTHSPPQYTLGAMQYPQADGNSYGAPSWQEELGDGSSHLPSLSSL